MAETVQEMLIRRKKEREKKSGAAGQAEELASPEKPVAKPTPAPLPAATPKPPNLETYREGWKPSDKPGRLENLERKRSTTPASDTLNKAERLKTLDDDSLSEKAAGGDFEAKAEAQRRFKAGNKKFKAYEKYGE